jgi:hypothetical protein
MQAKLILQNICHVHLDPVAPPGLDQHQRRSHPLDSKRPLSLISFPSTTICPHLSISQAARGAPWGSHALSYDLDAGSSSRPRKSSRQAQLLQSCYIVADPQLDLTGSPIGSLLAL